MPDILAISSPEVGDYGRTGARPLLIVEVEESSLRYDLSMKAVLYAEAGVPEYWVLDLVARELVVFRSAHEGKYKQRATYHEGDRLAPDAWPDVVLEIAELFPRDEPS